MSAIALSIAGSDSGGGAGIQADLKAMSALGVYGATVITAITAQNTKAVTAVQGIDPEVIAAQIDAVLSDLNVKAIKIGMLSTPKIIATVAKGLNKYAGPIVLDPVMISKSGDSLLQDEAISALISDLLPMASVLTPNLPEAARLLDTSEATSHDEMKAQGKALLALGPNAVLMKGGHAKGDFCEDLFIRAEHPPVTLSAPRIATQNTHGTGCTLSSSIAAELAKGKDLRTAIAIAHGYLQAAIQAADTLQVGMGHGPVHHFHAHWPPHG
ncbi:MAG: bifunctional hydroxymethylpyrimidine kinase/phosphomethylpyrimidine kinase [Pseudoruegeria sp.]